MLDDLVTTPEQRDWTPFGIEGAHGFFFQFGIIGREYSDAFSVDLCRIEPGGASAAHVDPGNHAFYILSGQGEVDIASRTMPLAPGSVVKIPVGVVHALRNTGEEPLSMLVIYDPPRDRPKS